MRTRSLIALAIIPLTAISMVTSVAGAAQAQTTVFATSSAKSDVPKKPGATMTEAEALGLNMESLVLSAVDELRPCSRSMRHADVAALLGWEKDRQLLGAGGD